MGKGPGVLLQDAGKVPLPRSTSWLSPVRACSTLPTPQGKGQLHTLLRVSVRAQELRLHPHTLAEAELQN